jgi:aspartate/methionine/tyrosine aminotransferase
MGTVEISQKLHSIKSPASIAIADKVRQLTSEGHKIAKMQTGEPFFDTPKYIIEGANQAMLEGKTHYSYSKGLPELRQEISKWYEEEYHVILPSQQILITMGAVHAIFCILSALLNPDDEVLIPTPSWPQYRYITALAGGIVCEIKTANNNARLTLELLELAVTKKSKILILNNPCNPSGIVYSQKEIEIFLQFAETHDLLILMDEVYSRITYSNKFCSVFSCPSYSKHMERVLYVNSFSKTFAMTGWRVGYTILPDSVGQFITTVSQNSITNVPPFCQEGARIALKKRVEHKEIFEDFNKLYQHRHNMLMELLQKKGIEFLSPEGAFYFFIKCHGSSDEFAQNLLEKEKIAVVPGSAYGEDFEHYYRISFAVDSYSFGQFVQWIGSQLS